MAFDLTVFAGGLMQKQLRDKLLACNEKTAEYGITLTARDAAAIVEARSFALKDTGRVEFGSGVAEEMVLAFCDSAYVSPDTFTETISRLMDIFYAFKNDSMDLLSDADMIGYMRKYFEQSAGDLDMLVGTYLENIAHNVRFGYPPEYVEYAEDGEED